MRLRRRTGRLDQPSPSRRSALVRRPHEPDAFGRVAERIARFIGTARFLVAQSIVVVLWIGYNIIVPRDLRFDNYPFIFLTLALSLQAAYAAPLILLAQNRQDDRDRANLAQDREQTSRQLDDTEYLAREIAAIRIRVGELATRDYLRSELRAELRALLAESLETSAGTSAGTSSVGTDAGTGEDVGDRRRRAPGSWDRRPERGSSTDRRLQSP
ncbi:MULTISPECIES: DUF1003 domain-containing protein [Protofrankia]|uniref:Integral membrane protein n=1 Tax=Candidatus Protofrankia datiscae TaxID=2716812 RepID=F8AWI8_9ACTN|nr:MULTISPECIES: DUF1003 domain-containing protein [Protofrankia]AEH08394.1 protein of unknown function DUF1003 [Candidatus Protofrankia datiscae]